MRLQITEAYIGMQKKTDLHYQTAIGRRYAGFIAQYLVIGIEQ